MYQNYRRKKKKTLDDKNKIELYPIVIILLFEVFNVLINWKQGSSSPKLFYFPFLFEYKRKLFHFVFLHHITQLIQKKKKLFFIASILHCIQTFLFSYQLSLIYERNIKNKQNKSKKGI